MSSDHYDPCADAATQVAESRWYAYCDPSAEYGGRIRAIMEVDGTNVGVYPHYIEVLDMRDVDWYPLVERLESLGQREFDELLAAGAIIPLNRG